MREFFKPATKPGVQIFPFSMHDSCEHGSLLNACASPKLLFPQLPPEHPPQPWEEVCAEQSPRVLHILLLDSAQGPITQE